MWRPNPIPYVFISLVVSINPNSLKSFSLSFSLIPMPESFTITSIIPNFDWITISLKT
jgi:hypothetical protein